MSSTPLNKANLARIRDNQRRSRARRKEYLQELEGKYRNCELLGVEASSEIQTAARRVAEENKKLRALLREKGVYDREVDKFVTGGSKQKATNNGETLEEILRIRKPCNGDSSCTRDSSEGSTPWELTHVSNPRGPSNVQPLQVHPVDLRTTDAVNITSSLTSQHPVTIHGVGDVPVNTDSQSPPSRPIPRDYSLTGELAEDPNTSSCVFAADIITSMAKDVRTEDLQEQLGCGTDTNCNVNNALLFNIMDRYSEQAISLDC
ncbi:MAG: hypothetical protein M1812_000870 [Candelaria pacifica]|nr:MAG: hypothetical protein M1812_000870 [Candelaria pacifica]